MKREYKKVSRESKLQFLKLISEFLGGAFKVGECFLEVFSWFACLGFEGEDR